MSKVKVYSTPTCPWCTRTKDFLSSNNIEFENIDVSSDTEASREMIEKSGQMAVPVIDIDGTIVVGFDEAKLRELLNL